jgi:diguanylate cyclase
LASVNEELTSIYQLLGGAADAEAAEREAGDVLSREFQSSVDVLSKGLALTDDIGELRSQLNEQLDHIKGALKNYQDHREAQPETLSDQLQVLASRVQAMEAEAQQSKEDYETQKQLALEDALTGLPNRQAYNERIFHEQQRWSRYQHPLTLAIADIDFFKRVNDTYGHQAGDRVLRVIGRAISKRLREVDFMARYGGEEFVLIMPETSIDAAFGILDKIREVLSETPFHFKEAPVQITLSIGVAEFKEGDTAESVFERADKALYEAKEGGRNQCRKL